MWKLFVAIDVSAIDGRLINLRKLYADAYKMCNGCLEEVELNLIHGRINRLEANKTILHQLMGKRHKRGLLNIFGTGFKTLFGTMDNNDLEYINGEMDKLYLDSTILGGTIQNQTTMIKTLLNSTSHNLANLQEHNKENVERYNRLTNHTNPSTRNLFLAHQLAICSIISGEIGDDIEIMVDAINDGKHGIVHPLLLQPRDPIKSLRSFEEHYNEKYPISLTEENYQHLIDISKVDIGILNSTLLHSIKLPLLEADQYSVQHLIPIPIKNGKSFLASLPDHEFLFLNDQKTLYVPADKESIKECKLIDTHRICKRSEPTHLLSESYTCETQIIRNSITSLSYKICQFSPFKIKDLVYVPLYSDESYVFIPEKEQELNIACRNFSMTKLISTANLVHSNDRCIITTDSLIIKTDKSV